MQMKNYEIERNVMDCHEIYQVLNFITKDVPAGDEQCSLSPSFYGNPLVNNIQEDLLPQIEKVFGKKMFSTYTYFRQYRNGEVLKVHQDRDACEYSITLCMGYDSPYCWPIFLREPNNSVHEVRLEPGDCLFYRGTICEHWRDKFEGKTNLQVFLHYVDQNGPYKDHKGDEGKSSLIAKTSK